MLLILLKLLKVQLPPGTRYTQIVSNKIYKHSVDLSFSRTMSDQTANNKDGFSNVKQFLLNNLQKKGRGLSFKKQKFISPQNTPYPV